MPSQNELILICSPTGQDATLAGKVLAEFGLASEICHNLEQVVMRVEQPCGAVLLAEEAICADSATKFKDALAQQEPWSDIPVLVMVSPQGNMPAGQRVLELFGASANVSLIERPFHTVTLVSSLQVLLRARRRQYQVKHLLEELRLALDQRDEFVSMASHELKTPLTSLKLQNQLTKRTLSRGEEHVPKEKLLRNVDTADKQLNRLSSLIESLLDVSRIRVGKMTVEAREADLSKITARVLEQMAAQTAAMGCPVSYEGAEGVVGEWDPDRLEQVVANLLSNACKYGGGKPVEVRVLADAGKGILLVRDQGKGIAPEHQKQIFERFERVEADARISGLGLGLYIVRQIVELHGGVISVESKVGQGSTFRVELPLRQANALYAVQ